MFLSPNSNCNKCNGPATMVCQRCHEVYCSADCQILDWKDHKSQCHQMPDLVPMLKVLPRLGSGCRTVNTTLNESSNVQTQQFHLRSGRNPLSHGQENYDITKDLSRPSLENNLDFTLRPKVIDYSDRGRNFKGAMPKKMPLVSAEVAWKIPFAPPQGEFFDAFVQWIEEDRCFLWVTEVKYDSPLRKLLMEINRNITAEAPCKVGEINSGDLVAAPLDGIFYRAEVLDTNNSTKLAKVRLIDYGNELLVNYNELRSSMPIMRNLNAYAIRVVLPEHQAKHDLKVESMVCMRILTASSDTFGDIYYVQMKSKSIPLHLPLNVLNDNPEMLVRKVFIGGQKALLQYGAFSEFDTEMNAQLAADTKNAFDFGQTPEEGAFLAAHTSDGWRRSCCLGYWSENQTYLVYLIDEARVEMCKRVKKIPDDFLTHSMRIIAITVTTTQDLLDEAQLSKAAKITLHPLASKAVKKDVQSLPCDLYINEQKINDVMATSFVGILNDFGVKCWPETIADGTVVYITHILSQSDIFISSVASAEYPKLFTSMATKCLPYKSNEELAKDEIVLATLTDTYFRAKILAACSSGTDLNTLLKVLDIDTGRCCNVPRGSIRKPNLFVRSCPVYVMKVKLIFVDRVPTPIENNKAISTLHQCKDNAIKFILKRSAGDSNTVDLLLKTDTKQSLSKQLLPLLFEESSIENEPKSYDSALEINISELAEETPLPPSPPSTPKMIAPELKRSSTKEEAGSSLSSYLPNLNAPEATAEIYTLDDLEIIPIVEGEEVALVVLDASTIDKGCITASDFSDKAFLQQMEQNLENVKKIGKCSQLQKNYKPKCDEICLTLFEDDSEWYRAVCLKVFDDETFRIMFLDFGNMCTVSKDNIRPITKELMFASNANLCMIKNLPPTLTKMQQLAFINTVTADPIIHCAVQRLEADTYKIEIHGIDTYFKSADTDLHV